MNQSALSQHEPLDLDSESLGAEELSIPALMREIGLKKKPNALLSKMMNILEQKRQKKGYGWSRAWNKYGLNVFRTHICSVEKDADYLGPLSAFLAEFPNEFPEAYSAFAKDLLSDPERMAFTFYHNNDTEEGQYEGLTISLGRKVVEDPTKRDRLDIILEDRRVDGKVDGKIDQVRLYVCPWDTYQNKEFHLEQVREFDGTQFVLAQGLYEHGIRYYNQWKGEEDRQWSHWSTRFIDYFGPRTFIPKGSCFT